MLSAVTKNGWSFVSCVQDLGTPSPTDVPALISEAVTVIRSKGRVKSLDVFRGWVYFF